ncbi:hypothetical protein VPH35_111624 [Triticum aestivum]
MRPVVVAFEAGRPELGRSNRRRQPCVLDPVDDLSDNKQDSYDELWTGPAASYVRAPATFFALWTCSTSIPARTSTSPSPGLLSTPRGHRHHRWMRHIFPSPTSSQWAAALLDELRWPPTRCLTEFPSRMASLGRP